MNYLGRKLNSLFSRTQRVIDRYTHPKKAVESYPVKNSNREGNPLIIHFNGNFVVGGSSQLIVDLIERCSEEFSHEVIVPEIPKPLPYQPLAIKAFPLMRIDGLKDYLVRKKPALVHIHYWVREKHEDYDFATWYREVFRICGELDLPVIQNINVPTRPYRSGTVVQNVFVSNYVLEQFNDQPGTPHSVIYPGSDLTHFSRGSDHSVPGNTIGMIYRLDSDKLEENAIDVFTRALQKMPELKCCIVGGGHFYESYRRRVKAAGLTDRFEFTGYVSYRELPRYYKKIDLVVAPVYDESFGQVTPFAMAMQLPVAGYDTGAISEILGSSGTLVKTGDVEALSDKIVQMMKDPAGRTRIGEQNRRRVEELFSVETMVGKYRLLYKQWVRVPEVR